MKKKAEDFASGGGVGGKSNRSEDDVFSDAVTEFPDSGISPRLEERFDNVRGLDKSIEQKVLEGDSGLVKVDETAGKYLKACMFESCRITCLSLLLNSVNHHYNLIFSFSFFFFIMVAGNIPNDTRKVKWILCT